MNTSFLLIMLTFNVAGQGDLSFVSTETLQQCQVKGQAVAAILGGNGFKIEQNRCIETKMKFSTFSHTAEGTKSPVYQYKAIFTPENVEVMPVDNLQTCEKNRPKSPENNNKIYCVASSQKML